MASIFDAPNAWSRPALTRFVEAADGHNDAAPLASTSLDRLGLR